jgi:Protein of unknown function (DUF3304)
MHSVRLPRNEVLSMRHHRSTRSNSRKAIVWTLASAQALCACAAPAESVSTAPSATPSSTVSLLLQGYNYTDHYIDSFSVNGQGGGNLFESGPTSGGGKSACCVVWQPGSALPVKIKVRWVAGYCMYREKNPYSFGDPYHEKRRSLWKEQEALITEAAPQNPRALEVHIYKDGRIEAAVTQGDSPPRLKLPREANYNRPGVSQEFPRCPDDTQ